MVAGVLLSFACGEAGEQDDGAEAQCDFEVAVDEFTADAAMDCGAVDLDDTQPAWVEAQTCALEAIANGTPVVLRWRPQTIDSVAWVAITADAGMQRWIALDDYMGDVSLQHYACSSVTQQAECAISVGQMCLACAELGDRIETCRP